MKEKDTFRNACTLGSKVSLRYVFKLFHSPQNHLVNSHRPAMALPVVRLVSELSGNCKIKLVKFSGFKDFKGMHWLYHSDSSCAPEGGTTV